MQATTITGMDLFRAFKELDRQLPPHAYKKIEAGKGGKLGLTDIIPAFLPELLMELFGPIGLGWGFKIQDMQTVTASVERKGGYTDTEFTATCRIACWYAYLSADALHQSQPIEATGASTNTQIEWAMKGAITNALGAAWFFAGYQLSVYKDERSHKNLKAPAAEPPPTTGELLISRFRLLDAPDLQFAYFRYVGEKYGISSIEAMTRQQISEQMAILNMCAKNPEKRHEFITLLRGRVPKQQTADA